MGVIDPAGRARAAIVLLWVWLLADAAFTASQALLIWVVSDADRLAAGNDPDGWPVLADSIAGVTGLAMIAVFIVTIVMVARWTYRVSANAHARSDAMTISPGWAVGWYFVPFANLIKPFEAMREIWQASFSPDDPEAEPVPGLLRAWWGLWLASSIAGNLSFQISMRMQTVEGLELSAWIDIATFVFDVPLVLVLTRLIARLSAQQAHLNDADVFE
ncbi:DUF4328 domain-containing protein [Sphingomonas sp.]|uniref:DUF4328 domain-containing protein n=1 Tax=Sphingomonas sp. TaxID=28214 RepID=UPI001EC267DA|nr:DUF4328 domain-containing protein [Sphingomonas sp.]MBX3595398.1 DUF4328 domain-containing protein [Sphingomonas sp.]